MDGDMLCAASMRCMEQHRRAASPWVRLAGRDGTVVQVEPHWQHARQGSRPESRARRVAVGVVDLLRAGPAGGVVGGEA